MPVETLAELFQQTVHENGPRTAMRYKTDGSWHSITYSQFSQLVEEASLGLKELGVEPDDRVGLLATNGPLWAVSDFAILHARAVTAPVYPTLTPDQVAYILEDAGAEVLFVGSPELYERAQAAAKDADGLETIVVMGEPAARELELVEGPPDPGNVEQVLTTDDLYKRGQTQLGADTPAGFDETWQAIEPDDLATLIYTSGTTGQPKGVELTHRNIVANVEALSEIIDPEPGQRFLSFLPLSHSFERGPGHFLTYHQGVEVWYAQSIDTIAEDLTECRPEMLIAVPRIWEKMKHRVDDRLEAAEDEGGLIDQSQLFEWALGVGRKVAEIRQRGDSPGLALRAEHWLADRLVLNKVRAAMGLDEMELAASGGAAIDEDLAWWLFSLGLNVYEGYGQTEASPVVAANAPSACKIGTVGKPLSNVDVRIDEEGWDGPEGEGEILVKGPTVMRGYWNKPAETEAAFTEGGWLKTGDVGTFDEGGFLLITDRKKELFKTAYGKYIAPGYAAGLLKREALVEHALVIGEDRKYVTTLIQPNFERLEDLADEVGVDAGSRTEIVQAEPIRERFEAIVEEANDELARYEQLKRFALTDREFEVGAELTPTLKIKRRVAEDAFEDLIETQLYPD
jgi:long-chain acyl-CoA synthetase